MKRIKYICLAVLCVVMAGCRTETVDLNQEVLNEEFREDNTLENVEMVINTEDITEVPEKRKQSKVLICMSERQIFTTF